MSKVDPQDFVGKRVFIKTDKKNYVGTLKTLREYSLEISDYFTVHQYDDKKILARGDFGSYTHIIMHSGGSREMDSIELNTLIGDPNADDPNAEDPDYVAAITPPAWQRNFAQDPGDEDDTDGVPGRVVESSNYDSVIDTGLGLCD